MILDETFLIRDARPPAFERDVIRLGSFQPRSFVAGPGHRAVIWVAGCLRRCPNCMKPDLFSFSAGHSVSVRHLADQILGLAGLDGITLSGGEPFEQSEPLSLLCRFVKAEGLSVAVYTGYRLDALQSDAARFGALLHEVDLLIDGEYRHGLSGPSLWHGSANQRIYVLRDGIVQDSITTQPVQDVQLEFSPQTLRLTGFPDQNVESLLSQRLSAKGIVLKSIPS